VRTIPCGEQRETFAIGRDRPMGGKNGPAWRLTLRRKGEGRMGDGTSGPAREKQ